MAKYGILFNVDRCIACQACFVACKEDNQVHPGMAWVRINRIEDPKARVISYFRSSCQHCEDPACMKVCPVKAVSKGAFGEVLVDSKKCIGCRMCLAACPYGVPQFNDAKVTNYFGDKAPLVERALELWQQREPGKAEHCTLCTHRLAEGRKPACVEYCSTGALELVDFEALTPEQKKRVEAARMMTAAAGTNPKVRYLSTHVDFSKVSTKPAG